jgi:hypothetical protein
MPSALIKPELIQHNTAFLKEVVKRQAIGTDNSLDELPASLVSNNYLMTLIIRIRMGSL